ncbi:winged helix-turn-helix transcriptional regulator [Kineothrix sp. MB12-C1]|uniref:winged helix-turn-helix transcriptional regulator n=1 Tax=Kineothrix sp. MB12-C1 TaxID=3070215 RepID=UPI0027D2FB23|nr:winged helix-turn-helix transcriptional regulator [Kineothrix sp. MB12-C1]WMC91423.1 winged helix-turn-helix transcriptional regulator [Kineothrix sp. MB12-C1]
MILYERKVMAWKIKKSLNNITHKMLSQQLKELESDGFIHREAYSQIPPASIPKFKFSSRLYLEMFLCNA